MRVAVLGSGSRGNAIALQANGASLLVDAGFGTRTVIRRARAARIAVEPLAGIVLTHEHGDHARSASRLAKRFACPVFGSAGTLATLRSRAADVRALAPHEMTEVGPFTIEAARTSHDAREPLAVAITGPGGVRVGIAYDLGRPTAAVKYLLRECSALVLEANHDDVLLRTGPYPASVRQRIAGSGGHLSNRAAARLAADLCWERLEAVILVHLSERCNKPDLARNAVSQALAMRRFRGAVYVAAQDVPVEAVDLAGDPQLALSLREPARPL